MKIPFYFRPKYPIVLVAGLCGLFTVVNLGFAQTWTPTGAPVGSWKTIAWSADSVEVIATGWSYVGYVSQYRPFPIYASSDSRARWTQTSAPSGWSSVASSADGTKLVAVTGDAKIYTSTNSGLTWNQTSAPFNNWSSVACSADGTKLVAAADEGVIYTSQSTPAPLLSIGHLSSNGTISWLVPSTSFGLQENSDLTTTNWTDVTNVPTLNYTNLHYEVAVPPLPGGHFYRLKQH